jgi:hypothetical protein
MATIRGVLSGPRGSLAAAVGALALCATMLVVGIAVANGRRAKPAIVSAAPGVIPGRCTLTAREAEPGKTGRMSLVIACDAEP